MSTWDTYRAAEDLLLELRRSQRGFPTLGDDADHALVAALVALPDDAAPVARDSGARIGAQVWSRRYHEEGLARAIDVLSEALILSGVGALRVESTFHRHARVVYEPSPPMARAGSGVRNAFVEGALAGFLGETHNCEADARRLGGDVLDVELGAGRDVNRLRGVA